MPTLMVLITSTRPGRAGEPIARWFAEEAATHGGFDVDLADLAEIALPFMDEPKHPSLRQYEHDHTKAWSERVDRADAFVFVTPEYNHGMTAQLKNALDYLNQEWANKAVGFVSYGGVSGGTRAVQHAKAVLGVLRLHAVAASVNAPMFQQFLEEGEFRPNLPLQQGATAMLDELAAVTEALRPLRA